MHVTVGVQDLPAACYTCVCAVCVLVIVCVCAFVYVRKGERCTGGSADINRPSEPNCQVSKHYI